MQSKAAPTQKQRRPPCKQSSPVPPVSRSVQAQKYKFLRKKGIIKDSVDLTTLDEGISINKPRISGQCKISMTEKNKEIAQVLAKLEKDFVRKNKERFAICKVVTQLNDRPIEWIEISKLDPETPHAIPTLETETYSLLSSFALDT